MRNWKIYAHMRLHISAWNHMQNPHGLLYPKCLYVQKKKCISGHTSQNTTLLSTFRGWGSNFILLLYILRWVGGRAHAPLMTKNQKVVFDPSSKIWDCLICLSTRLLPCAELHPIMAEWAMNGPWMGAKSIRSGGKHTIVTGCSKYVTISRPNL